MKKFSLGSISVERVVESIGLHKSDFLFPELKNFQLKEQKNWLIPDFIDKKTNDLIMSFHSYLLKTENSTILIDTCVGNDKERVNRPFWHHLKTPYLKKLKKLNVNPEDVDYVMCTHLHADHVGWNTKLENNQWVPTFPNAKYIFSKNEYNHWHEMIKNNDEINHGSFQDSVLPIIEKGDFKLVDNDYSIEDYLFFESAPGHTPGNMIINITSGKDKAVLCGDTIHHAIQLSFPEISSRFCEDPIMSAVSRRKMLTKIADTDTILLPAHFPKVGKVISNKDSFSLNY